jgi:hypothetical protein
MRQLNWSTPVKPAQIAWSVTAPHYHRFSIMETSTGYTVCDHVVGDLARVTTLAAARAWAGIRVGEQDVRHG